MANTATHPSFEVELTSERKISAMFEQYLTLSSEF